MATGKQPKRPYNGTIIVRVDPEIHRRVAMKAAASRKSMNKHVQSLLEKATEDFAAPQVRNRVATQEIRSRRKPPKSAAGIVTLSKLSDTTRDSRGSTAPADHERVRGAQGARRAVPGAAAGCEADGESPKDRSEAEP